MEVQGVTKVTDARPDEQMSLSEQLRRLTSGGPGVTFIASETLFEDAATAIERADKRIKELEAQVLRLATEVESLQDRS